MGFELCGLYKVLGRDLALFSSTYFRLTVMVLAFVSVLCCDIWDQDSI